jgi:hypothetical protein
MQDGAEVVLRRNVFAGFGELPVLGLPQAERDPMRAANVVVASNRSPRQAGDR